MPRGWANSEEFPASASEGGEDREVKATTPTTTTATERGHTHMPRSQRCVHTLLFLLTGLKCLRRLAAGVPQLDGSSSDRASVLTRRRLGGMVH